MTPSEHSKLVDVALDQLRPTQMTAGFAEVARKRADWAALTKKQRHALLDSHWFPAVYGPGDRYYIVDHHHLGLALLQEGVKHIRVTVLADLSYLAMTIFWRVMEQRNWAHPFDATGRRRDFGTLPGRLRDLQDDPYRSVAGFLRGVGGYAKDTSPFAEFLWADYLRPHLTRKQIRTSMDAAVSEALGLARSPLARYLPGWSGSTPPAS
ncbi:MAG: chromosome partitioning protein ParB [Pseudomonadota bacterium]|nr:chromosome partitioning protein ParB [Pseudomonadota bacterium]